MKQASSFSSVLVRIVAHVLAFAILVTATKAPALEPFRFIGEFSDVRHTAEHAYGYTVQLWQEGNQVFGLFSDASGPAEDLPAGLLENVQFNPSTRRFSFSARLSIGVIYLGQGKQEPTHDYFSFKGSLNGNLISGVLTHVDRLQPRSEPSTKRLRLQKTNNPAMIESNHYGDWKQRAEQLLSTRGPKW